LKCYEMAIASHMHRRCGFRFEFARGSCGTKCRLNRLLNRVFAIDLGHPLKIFRIDRYWGWRWGYDSRRMRDIKALLRSIPRRDWLFSGAPRYLHVCRSDMRIEIHAASGGSGINTCETVMVTVQSANSIPQSFTCPRSEVLK
jgi:hypothetical protein